MDLFQKQRQKIHYNNVHFFQLKNLKKKEDSDKVRFFILKKLKIRSKKFKFFFSKSLSLNPLGGSFFSIFNRFLKFLF